MTSTNDQNEPKNDQNEPKLDLKSENRRNIELISQWYQNYYLWTTTYMLNSLMNNQSYKLIPNYANQAFSSQQNIPNIPNIPQTRVNINVRIQTETIQISNYKIPTLLRRFMAEFIDAVYIQICKIILAIVILNYTNLIDEDSFNFFEFIEDMLSEENFNNIKFPMELFFLEVIYVSISVGFEAFCLYQKGYTLGKYLMNLKVISCNSTIDNNNNNTVRVIPGTRLSFKSTIIRTCLKNFSIFILFPTIVFFLLPAFTENGQTSYDKAADTIVVECQ